jgi:hypothetical protein
MKHKSVLNDSMRRTMTDASLPLYSPVDYLKSLIPSVVDVGGYPVRSSAVTHVKPFLNMAINSYTLYCRKALFPYYAESLRLIFAPGTPSAHKIGVTAFASHIGSSYCYLHTN